MMKKLMLFPKIALFLGVTLLFNSCLKDNGDNTSYPDVVATDLVVNGTLKYKDAGGNVVAWPFGIATLKAIVGIGDVIATADVDIAGNFDLVLPGTLSGNYFTSLASTASLLGGTTVSTPNTIRYLNYTEFKVYFTENGNTQNITVNPSLLKTDFSIDKSYYFNFFDDAGTLSGTSSSSNVFNWAFGKGWNAIEVVITNSTSGVFTSKTVAYIPSSAVWVNQ